MATNCAAGPDNVKLARQFNISRAVGDIPDTYSPSYTSQAFTNGSGAKLVDRDYGVFGGTLAAGARLTLNLQSFTDEYGTLAQSFARLKRLFFSLRTDTPASAVLVGGPAVASPTAAPALATAATGGTLAAGTWSVAYSWTTASGETEVSPAATQVTTGAASTITVTPPATPAGATGYNVYVSLVVNALALAKSNAAVQTGATYTFTAAPATGNAAVPGTNTTANGISSIWRTGRDGLVINNGCCVYLGMDPGVGGYAVGASNNFFYLTNLDQGSVATYDLLLTGCSS
jgi:hypothetical protein